MCILQSSFRSRFHLQQIIPVIWAWNWVDLWSSWSYTRVLSLILDELTQGWSGQIFCPVNPVVCLNVSQTCSCVPVSCVCWCVIRFYKALSCLFWYSTPPVHLFPNSMEVCGLVPTINWWVYYPVRYLCKYTHSYTPIPCESHYSLCTDNQYAYYCHSDIFYSF